jgi:hypothetical protein
MKVDRKSKRDVVTNVDYASEASSSRRSASDSRRTPSWPRSRGASTGRRGRRAVAGRSERGSSTHSTGPSTTPTEFRSSASRSAWSKMACRWSAWSSTRCRRLLRGDRGGPPRSTASGWRQRQGELGDFVASMAIIGRGGIARERRVAHEIRIGGGWGARRWRWRTWGRADSTPSCRTAGCPCGTSPRPASSPSAPARRHRPARRRVVERRQAGPRLSIVAAPEPHHGKLLELLRAARTTVETRRP